MEFKVKIEDVVDLKCGKTVLNVVHARGLFGFLAGKLKCDDTVLEVLTAFPAFVGPDDPYDLTFNCISNNATKDMIGKTFYYVENSAEEICERVWGRNKTEELVEPQPEKIAESA